MTGPDGGGPPDRTAGAGPPALIYIAGYGCSGSTFLDTVLGSHPDIASAGELAHLYTVAAAGGACSCGEVLEACRQWSPVLANVTERLPGVSWSAARDVTDCCEHLLAAPRPASIRRAYEQLWSATLTALFEATGARYVIDSSKTQAWSARRLAQLQKRFDTDVRTVHLTRDPRAVIWSVRTSSHRGASPRRQGQAGMVQTAAAWSVANLAAEWATRPRRTHHIRYEDLVGSPAGVLEELGRVLGVDLSGVSDRLETGEAIPVGHGIAGNRMRTAGPVQLRPDRRWVREASLPARLAALPTAPLARRYGYRIRPAVPQGPRDRHW